MSIMQLFKYSSELVPHYIVIVVSLGLYTNLYVTLLTTGCGATDGFRISMKTAEKPKTSRAPRSSPILTFPDVSSTKSICWLLLLGKGWTL